MSRFEKLILIPSYEPDEMLINLVKGLREDDFEVLVVDDGSGPKYRKIFRETSKYAKVISYDENRGKGHALRMGLRFIRDNFEGEYIVCTMDSDGQHAIEDARHLITYSMVNTDKLVLGKRELGKGIPFKSRLGNNITRFLYKFKMGKSVYDNQTGLRTFSHKLVPMMCKIGGERYIYEMNVIMTCEAKHIPIKEIPIKTIYINGNKGSHFHPWKDSFSLYGSMLAFSPTLAKKYW